MNKLAQKRRKNRFERGSVAFNNSDSTFFLDPESMAPLAFTKGDKMLSKELVEEFMLLANILVSEFLRAKCGGKAILRVHEDIQQSKKDELKHFFSQVDLPWIDLADSKALNRSLEKVKSE